MKRYQLYLIFYNNTCMLIPCASETFEILEMERHHFLLPSPA